MNRHVRLQVGQRHRVWSVGAPWTSTSGGSDPLVQYAIWVLSRDATRVLVSAWAGNSAHAYLLLVSVSASNPGRCSAATSREDQPR
jgi:hypothetical protein